jgi:hypothetical protein
VIEPNWSRRLPHALNIPGVTTLTTLADVRGFVKDHRSAECWGPEWHRVTNQLNEAAQGGDIDDMVISLRLVLELERVPCLMTTDQG